MPGRPVRFVAVNVPRDLAARVDDAVATRRTHHTSRAAFVCDAVVCPLGAIARSPHPQRAHHVHYSFSVNLRQFKPITIRPPGPGGPRPHAPRERAPHGL